MFNMSVCTRNDLRPNDVLLGRGRPIQTWSGNVRFRSLVSERQAEYDAATKNSDKQRIAAELVQSIREGGGGGGGGGESDGAGALDNSGNENNSEAPGRFLRPLTRDEVERLGVDYTEGVKFADLWTVADDMEDRILDKVKQVFRQNRFDHNNNSKSSDKTRKKGRGAKRTGEATEGTRTAESSGSSSSSTAAAMSAVVGGAARDDVVAFDDLEAIEDESNLMMKLGGDMTLDAEAAEAAASVTFRTEQQQKGNFSNSNSATAGAMEHAWESGADPLMTRLLDGLGTSIDMSGFAMMDPLHVPTIDDPYPVPLPPPTPGAGSSVDNVASHASTGTEISDNSLPLIMKISAALGVARTLAEDHREAPCHDNENKIQNDLKTLGLVLFQLFAGVAADDANGSSSINKGDQDAAKASINIISGDDYQPEQRQCKRTELVPTNSISSSDMTLRNAGLPSSICTLVISLLEATDPSAVDRYTSAADVVTDLLRMESNPDQFVLYPPLHASGILDFTSGRLYGREEEYTKLMSAFDSVIVRQTERRGLVLLEGPAGSGKTSLANKLCAHLAEQRGMVVSVKFESQGSEQPIPKLFRAIEEYCQRLLLGDASLLAEVGLAVKDALGSDGAVLKNLIPSLAIVVGGWQSSRFDMEQRETYNLILYCFRSLVRAISGPTHPVIWLLDDLQWSDSASLDIIRLLISDQDLSAMLFVGCFRGGKVPEGHALNPFLGDIAQYVPYTETISVGNLDKDSVNALLSDLLHLSPRLTRPLAGLLWTMSAGNPMFIKQLLRSLCDEGMLQYSAMSRRWTWDLDAISATKAADNTVDLIENMMRNYGAQTRWALQTSSCLGLRFDAATIKLLYSARSLSSSSAGERRDVLGYLETLVLDGLIIKKGSMYRFSHDQVWQAAYALTPPCERQAMHICIGRHLLRSAPDDEVDAFIFTIVDQLNRGVDIINDHTERLKIAELNLKAGEKALSALSFLQASIYLLQGSVLINVEDWQSDHYNLCLNLFTACAEVQLAQGNDDAAILAIEPVLSNGKTLDDRLRAHHALIVAKTAQMNFHEAIQHALGVLEQLGESFPVDIDQSIIMTELRQTLELIGPKTVDDILSIATTTDARKIALFRFLIVANRAAYVANPSLTLLIILRKVQIAMLDGLTAESSYAFATLSFALCNFGNYEMSAFCADVAIALLMKFDQKYSHSVITIVNASILPYRQPLQACLDPLRRAYKDARAVGDSAGAHISANLIVHMIIAAPERGKTLNDVENEIRQIRQGALQEGKKFESALDLMFLQVVLNLKSIPTSYIPGEHEDPTILKGEAFDQDEYMAMAREKQLHHFSRKMCFCQMYIAYLFRRYAAAAEKIVILSRDATSTTCDTVLETFYVGLIAAAMLGQSNFGNDDGDKWRMLATESTEKLKKWTNGSEWNFRHKYDLLRAELAAVGGEIEAAATAYDNAILGASDHSYINEQALACERAGLFYLQNGDMSNGREYLLKAEKLYNDWGAKRKAIDLSQLMQQRCRS